MINFKFFAIFSLLLVVDAKLTCDCQPDVVTRIVNGETTEDHEFPWQLSLGLIRDGKSHHICGASLLNENWAMTASHCVYGYTNESQYTIGYGSYDLLQMTEDKRIPAKRIYIHPQYQSRNANTVGDIALIELSRPVNMTSATKPACLMRSLNKLNDTLTDSETNLTASGFGSVTRTYKWWFGPIRGGKIEPRMKKATFKPDQQSSVCKNRNDLICIKPIKKGDSVCNGDSGGPLHMVVEGSDDSPNRISVIGVTSFGLGDFTLFRVNFCNGTAAYTKIAYFNSWVAQYINEENLCMI